MKISSLLLVFLASLPLVARAAETAPAAAAADKLFAVTITSGPAWDAAKSANDQKFFKEHSANLARMRTESVLLLGGRYADKGLIIVRAADETAVRAQLAQDPSIVAGTFQATVDEYRPFYHGDTKSAAAAAVASAATAAKSPPAPAAAPVAAQKNFLIVLHPIPRLYDEKAWTPEDTALVGKHFARLQEAVARGQVILAGRTEESLDKTMGMIVFSAADEAAAREFMNGDPCVAGGIMTGTLHPYGVALRAK